MTLDGRRRVRSHLHLIARKQADLLTGLVLIVTVVLGEIKCRRVPKRAGTKGGG